MAYFLPACILRQVKWAVRQILTQKNASRPSSSLRGTKGHSIRIIWDVSHELHNDFLTNSPLTEELIRFFQPQSSGAMVVLCNLHPSAFLAAPYAPIFHRKGGMRGCSNLSPLRCKVDACHARSPVGSSSSHAPPLKHFQRRVGASFPRQVARFPRHSFVVDSGWGW